MRSRAPARRIGWVLFGLLLGCAAGEISGWPFLHATVERTLQAQLGRAVRLTEGGQEGAAGFSLRLLGSVRMHLPAIEIGGPSWMPTPATLQAEAVDVEWRYADLWRARHGQALPVRALHAARLQLHLTRAPDGRASWQLDVPASEAPTSNPSNPSDTSDTSDTRTQTQRRRAAFTPGFGQLTVQSGSLHYDDAAARLQLQAQLSVQQDHAAPEARTSLIQAQGRYRGEALRIEMRVNGALPWVSSARAAAPAGLPVQLQAQLGSTRLQFEGSVASALALDPLMGHFELSGASLGAIGDSLGLTLPQTHALRATGWLKRQGSQWSVVVEQARVGRSRLNGQFVLDRSSTPPLLSGRLGGAQLGLVDLAPAIGQSASPTEVQPALLPTRALDWAALRAMDADVRVDIQQVELGQAFAEPLKPLRAHVQLSKGQLQIRDLLARSAAGTLQGELRFDSAPDPPHWQGQLSWRGLRLEQWLRASAGGAPLLAGELRGQLQASGVGRSTAQILGSLQGHGEVQWLDGSVSFANAPASRADLPRLLLRVAQHRDSIWPIDCASAQFSAEQGVVRPHAAVLVTPHATLVLSGGVSFADEALDLSLAVAPKDFSPASMHTPIQLRGRFASPTLSLSARPLVARGATSPASPAWTAAAALAKRAPFMDPGQVRQAQHDAAHCGREQQGAEP